MTYTELTTIKPSEVYPADAREEIISTLKHYRMRIVAFRPPAVGEQFITYWYSIGTARNIWNTNPRFIVEPLGTPRDWWE
jgi:hypothetical protein